MSHTTKYSIVADGTTLEGTKSKKATAVEAAKAHRDEHKVAVQVVTDAGKVVFELAAPKKINMSPQYTRTVSIEGVEVPEGKRVAYKRPRVGLAVLSDDREDADKDKRYSVLDLKTGKERAPRFATTRAVGNFMTAEAEKVRVRKAEAAAKDAEQKASEPAPEPVSA